MGARHAIVTKRGDSSCALVVAAAEPGDILAEVPDAPPLPGDEK